MIFPSMPKAKCKNYATQKILGNTGTWHKKWKKLLKTKIKISCHRIEW